MGVSRFLLCAAWAMVWLLSAAGARADFASWINTTKAEAVAAGINPLIAEQTLSTVQFIPEVIRLDRKQPEKKLTFLQYYANMVTANRISAAKARHLQNQAMLGQVQQAYGVPSAVVVALWAVESSFGENMGTYDLPSVLATLAYEGRRAAFFKEELFNAMRMMERGIPRAKLKGSWAGAMGQSQFMPSSYLRYAVDFDRSGLADIWSSKPDVFASIAHYLASEGWESGGRCVQRVTVPAGFQAPKPWHSVEKPIAEWLRMGVRLAAGEAVDASRPVRLVVHDQSGNVGYFAYPNFSVIMKWNRSTYFATTVCRLAEQIQPHNREL